MNIKCLILPLLVGALSTVSVTAQTEQADTTHSIFTPLERIDYSKINLPPVSIFLDAAQTYASVKYYDAKVREEEQNLKISRKDWLQYIRLVGSYEYGTNSTNLLQSGQNLPQEISYYSRNVQSWYSGGVAVSIPLSDIFTRKNKNNVYRTRLLQTEFEREKSLEDRQILILEAYNEVIKNLALLKVNAQSVALYNAQMKISERDFINGTIDIISLSLERGRRTDATIKFQESRAALHNAVTILEMLTKIKIIQ